jgi:hypothetical protein
VNLYVAGAALGATMTTAVAAVWIFGSGGGIDGAGSQSARAKDVMDMQVAPYVTRVSYSSGASGVLPVSIAFRVTDKQAGTQFCRDLARIQMEVHNFLRTKVRGSFSWPNFAAAGHDKEMVQRVNKILGGRVVDRVFMTAGDRAVGERPVSCARLARM